MKNNSQVIFIYAGGIVDKEYKEQIDQYAIENNIVEQIRYVGELRPGTELNNFYSSADAFIFPSIAEAFSLVIIESMAAGSPVFMDKNGILEIDEQLKAIIDSFELLNNTHIMTK